jgi:hypothetical protein
MRLPPPATAFLARLKRRMKTFGRSPLIYRKFPFDALRVLECEDWRVRVELPQRLPIPVNRPQPTVAIHPHQPQVTVLRLHEPNPRPVLSHVAMVRPAQARPVPDRDAADLDPPMNPAHVRAARNLVDVHRVLAALRVGAVGGNVVRLRAGLKRDRLNVLLVSR